MKGLDPKITRKIVRNARVVTKTQNTNLFKKLNNDIWEFRTRHGFSQIRILAFWDKTDKDDILILATHGFIKKTDKVPGNEIQRAINIRNKYFDSKNE